MDLTGTRRKLAARLRFKVRVPFTRRQVSGVPVLVVVAAVVAGTTAGRLTHRPVLCSSCHEMRAYFGSWSQSSHKDVTCDQCHEMPGWTWMMKAKLGGVERGAASARGNPSEPHGRVRDESCRKCHTETRDVIVYHGLKITHRQHWDRHISCLRCHARVVHGRQGGVRNVPTMQMCFECHDGRTAPNACGTCHETLGQRKAAAFSSQWVEGHKEEVRHEGREDCLRCHDSSFCDSCHRMVTPHPSNWIQIHPERYNQDPNGCLACHPKSDWRGFCDECHSVRRAHQPDWVTKHPAAVRKDAKFCNACHERNFCSDCHKRYKHHPADWIETHPKQAKVEPESCHTCHTEQFCVGCHQNGLPASHQAATWAENHGLAVEQEGGGCRSCHQQAFCMGCHKSKKLPSHSGDWRRLHGAQASAGRVPCSLCHAGSYCQQCHGLRMPHPANWQSLHRQAAKQSRASCGRCHQPAYCAACHRGARPASHTSGWIRQHGAQARQSDRSCMNCHTRNLCTSCHKSARPASHSANWLHTHGKSTTTGRQGCSTCHEKSYCVECHGGVEMPHPSGWVMGHTGNGASFEAKSPCFKCHDKKEFCGTCHSDKV